MNYPQWLLEQMSGGSWIALIAVLHVYIAHLAVGGGLFIWLMDRRAYLKKDAAINDFLRRYNWIFLLTTMVFGAVTGVGIWFIISLVSPAATSLLIHNFVFGWAIEWVFFVGEIVALLIYHYYFDRLERKTRVAIAFFYALFAWLSLVVINGILSFMLTPGQWLETGSFWHGFLNPGYFPSTLFRTFGAIMIAGIFAIVVGALDRIGNYQSKIARTGLWWVLAGFVGTIPTGLWYYAILPQRIRITTFFLNNAVTPWITVFIVGTILLLIFAILNSIRKLRPLHPTIAILIAVAGLMWMGGFEYIREIARKPYVVYDYMYSNSILKSDVPSLQANGLLPAMRWNNVGVVTPENELAAGRQIFETSCLACHSTRINNNIVDKTRDFTYLGTLAHLKGQGVVQEYMPPFIGTETERIALAKYLTSGLHGNNDFTTLPGNYQIPKPKPLPDLNRVNEEYVLLAWNEIGMRCISDCDVWFTFMYPNTTLDAQLIRKGDPPEIITENVRLTYEAPEDHRNPASQVAFWDFAEHNTGKKLERNIGISGNGMTGEMTLREDLYEFRADKIPVVPYSEIDNSFSPYPLFQIEAHDTRTDELLARTWAVAPTSTEMGCRNCHGGGWRVPGAAGVSDETAINILRIHDQLSGTTLLAEAKLGRPQSCQSAGCHGDPAAGVTTQLAHLDLSTSIHGWHANYMPAEGADACKLCHPAYKEGFTRCLRGLHGQMGFECTDCHGDLNDHALSLLRYEMEKPTAQILAEDLKPVGIKSVEEIKPRKSWGMQPDCLNCHADFEPPVSMNAFNKWTKDKTELFKARTDQTGKLRCSACHGAPHSVHPARNEYGIELDNLQSLQYQGNHLPIGSNIRCDVCHTVIYDFAVHHGNMVRNFRTELE